MHRHILLPAFGSIIWANHILGHVVPSSGENMNGAYLISNPNLQSANTFSTRFSDRPNVEYFDVYTPEISTRYIISYVIKNYNLSLAKHTYFSSDTVKFSGP